MIWLLAIAIVLVVFGWVSHVGSRSDTKAARPEALPKTEKKSAKKAVRYYACIQDPVTGKFKYLTKAEFNELLVDVKPHLARWKRLGDTLEKWDRTLDPKLYERVKRSP